MKRTPGVDDAADAQDYEALGDTVEGLDESEMATHRGEPSSLAQRDPLMLTSLDQEGNVISVIG